MSTEALATIYGAIMCAVPIALVVGLLWPTSGKELERAQLRHDAEIGRILRVLHFGPRPLDELCVLADCHFATVLTLAGWGVVTNEGGDPDRFRLKGA